MAYTGHAGLTCNGRRHWPRLASLPNWESDKPKMEIDVVKRTSIFLSILTLSVLILSACGPTVDEAKSDFCSDLNELDAAVNSLRSVTSLNDVKQAGEDIGDTWDQVVKSGESLEDVQLDATREEFHTRAEVAATRPSVFMEGDFLVGQS